MRTGDKHGSDQLAAMRAFLAVAEIGSFAGAAKQLGVHGSTVSKLVGKLEERLSVKLLQRNTKHVHLTEAGNLYLSGISKVICELDRIGEEIVSGTQSLSGEIRIGISSVVGSVMIGTLLDEFAGAHPSVRLFTKISDQPFDIVQSGVSVAIIPLHWHTPDSFVRRSLHTYNYALVAAGAGPTACGTARDATGTSFVISGDAELLGVEMARLVDSLPRHLIETNNTDLQKKLIAHLGGIGVLPSHDIGAMESGDRLQVLRAFDQAHYELCLVYATRMHLPRATRAFIDHAIAFFSRLKR